jgi:hypothetical protein
MYTLSPDGARLVGAVARGTYADIATNGFLKTPPSPRQSRKEASVRWAPRARAHSSLLCRSTVQPQNDDRGDDGLHRPCNHRKAVSHCDLLLTVNAVRDHPAADPAALA